MAITLIGQALVAGDASGPALTSDQPLSFWGGYDQKTGEIIDRRHPLSGQVAAGKVLVLPLSRGSSTTAAVFLEAVRRGTAPAAIVTDGIDRFLTLASIVAEQMYEQTVPILALAAADFARLRDGMQVTIRVDGSIHATADGESGDNRQVPPNDHPSLATEEDLP